MYRVSEPVVYKKDVSVPSYIKYFETEYKRINLIHSKKPSTSSQSEDFALHEGIKENLSNKSVEECDLTGDPLKVDLGQNDSVILINKDEIVNSWSRDEARHFPLTVTKARQELNTMLRELKTPVPDIPTFAVCDGKDSNNTIILGGYNEDVVSYIVEGLGLIAKSDNSIDLDSMVKHHLKSCRVHNKTLEVNYVTKIKYNVYGKSMKNQPCQSMGMRDFESCASVTVDISCNECIFHVYDQKNLNIMMNIEMIAGHRLLSLKFLWDDMYLLQTYLDILLDNSIPINDETILCKNPLEPHEILKCIEKLVRQRFLRIATNSDTIDLENLRNGDFLDDLWDILKYCENASILRDSFHFLFEEIAESNNKSIMIRDKTLNVALLIDGIINGKLILSAITLQQAIELLFDLGAYKIKNDFQEILKHFSFTMKATVDAVWKEFVQKSQQVVQGKSRATRVTQSLHHSTVDVKTKQLAYLSQLYVGAELIWFVKEQIRLPDSSFCNLCGYIENEYVANSKKIIDFLEIYQSPLCEMTLQLNLQNISLIESLLPSFWSMQMNSNVSKSTVTTIYILSESQIFPPSIYNDCDMPDTDDDKMVYFASRMTKIKGLF